MGKKSEEERSAARDYVMARLGAARTAVAAAVSSIDEMMMLFCDPTQDKSGERRGELLEATDEALGEAAISVHLAQGLWEDVDPKEGEPDPDDDDDDDDGDD